MSTLNLLILSPDNKEHISFMKAIRAGDAKEVKKWLDHGISANSYSLNKQTGSTMGELVEVSQNIQTVLMSAVTRENLEVVRVLLENGADPNLGCLENAEKKNSSNKFSIGLPLHLAVMKDKPEIMELLISFGANIDGKSEGPDGWTPLIFASYYCCPKAVVVLLKNGASQTMKSKYNENSGHWMKRFGRNNPQHQAILEAAIQEYEIFLERKNLENVLSGALSTPKDSFRL